MANIRRRTGEVKERADHILVRGRAVGTAFEVEATRHEEAGLSWKEVEGAKGLFLPCEERRENGKMGGRN